MTSGDEVPSVAGPLGARLRRGAALSGLAVAVVQVMALVSTLLLARLLTPAEVGVYAAGTVLTGFLVMFSEGGLRAALVQRETDVEDTADTVFWATAVAGILLSLLALASAPVIAVVFRNELAGQIAAVTSGMLLMHALTNVPDGLMQRRFNFTGRLIVDPSRAFAFGAVAIALAASGFGVWSLVIGNYVSLAVWIVGSWLIAGWRPGRGRPSVRLWRELARFGTPLLLQSLVFQIRETAETALVGRRLGETSLGHLTYGRRLGMLPGVVVMGVGSYVLFPAFSRLARERERLKDGYLRVLTLLWFVCAPLAAMIVAFGEPAVVVLLGERWRAAGAFLVAMSGYAVGTALKASATEVIKGTGRSTLLNWTSAAQLVLGVGLVVLALPFGLLGVGLAISVTEVVVAAVLLGLARSVVGFSLRELLGRLVPPLLGSVVALAVFGPLEHLVTQSDERAVLLGLVLLVSEVLGFLAVYLAFVWLIDRSVIAAAAGALRRRQQPEQPAVDPAGSSGNTPTRSIDG